MPFRIYQRATFAVFPKQIINLSVEIVLLKQEFKFRERELQSYV